MKLTKEEVKHIGQLASLKLSSEEIKTFQKQLSEVLDYVAKLQELKTSKVKPTSQVTGLKNIFREDKIGQSFSQKEALSNAKITYRGYFVTEAIF